MGRGKTEIKPIKNEASRSATFRGRSMGLLKKALELSVLCEAEILVVAFSRSGRLSQFAYPNSKAIIERYKKNVSGSPDTSSTCPTPETDTSSTCPTPEINARFYQQESEKLRQQIQMLENTNRSITESLNMEQLKQLENRLERDITRIKKKIADNRRLQELEKRLQEVSMSSEEYNAVWEYLFRHEP